MIHTAWHLATRPQHAHLRLRQWAHMLGFRGHFSTRTRHYSTTLAHLRAERTAWRARQSEAHTSTPTEPAPVGRHAGQPVSANQPVTDRRSDHGDLATNHRNGHCAGHYDVAGQRSSADTILVISHWRYAGTGLLPELAHLADLLEARRPARPDGRRPDSPGHSGGHRPSHPGHGSTRADRQGVTE